MRKVSAVLVATALLLLATSVEAKARPKAADATVDDGEGVEVGVPESDVVTLSHTLETQVAPGQPWHVRGEITTSKGPGVSPKHIVKFTPDALFSWSKKDLDLLKQQKFIKTRVQRDGATVASVLVSPCALITTGLRSSGQLHFHESYAVLVNPAMNNSVAGLQYAPIGREDLCELSLFDAMLDKSGKARSSVSVTKMTSMKAPATPTATLLYPNAATQPGAPAPEQPKPKKIGKDGKPEKEEEEQQGFLQKYWWVFLIMFGVQVAGAVLNPQAAKK